MLQPKNPFSIFPIKLDITIVFIVFEPSAWTLFIKPTGSLAIDET